MVYPTTFMERYNEWWDEPCQSIDDIQFATLLLRLCSYTAQFLPSQTYTADTILGNSLYALRERCNATAISLTHVPMMDQGLPSINRIHEHFFHACYLKNEGAMKESWRVLGKAIHEAHELGLHLETRKFAGRSISECDIEIGKRTYWNLWLWDKYVAFFLRRLNSPLRFLLCTSEALYASRIVSMTIGDPEANLQVIGSCLLSWADGHSFQNNVVPYRYPKMFSEHPVFMGTRQICFANAGFRSISPESRPRSCPQTVGNRAQSLLSSTHKWRC